MKTPRMKPSLLIAMMALGLYVLPGCTSSDQEDGKEQSAEGLETSSEGDAASADAAAEEAPADSGEGGGNDSDQLMKAVEEAGTEESAVDTTEAEAAPAEASAPETPAAQESAAPESGRRVWYVKTKGASVFDSTQAGAKEVRKVRRGDPILVSIQGEWGKISDNQWIRMSDLAQEPVGRERKGGKWDGR